MLTERKSATVLQNPAFILNCYILDLPTGSEYEHSHTHTPEQGFSGEPDLILLDGLPGEEEEDNQHGHS